MLTEEQIAAFVASMRAGDSTAIVALADRLAECGDAMLIKSAMEQIAGIKVVGKCQYEGCEQPAKHLACGRTPWDEFVSYHPRPACYCKTHADVVSDEHNPEYCEICPNCVCHFGVN